MLKQFGTQHWCKTECDKTGKGDGGDHCASQLAKQQARLAGQKHHWYKHRAYHDGGRNDGEGNLPGTSNRGDQGRFALFDAVIDIFENDNRVVNHKADRKDKRQQRQQVDRKSENPQHGKGRKKTDRHGNCGNNGCPPTAQKKEDHEHNKRGCLRQCRPNAIDCFADKQ